MLSNLNTSSLALQYPPIKYALEALSNTELFDCLFHHESEQKCKITKSCLNKPLGCSRIARLLKDHLAVVLLIGFVLVKLKAGVYGLNF